MKKKKKASRSRSVQPLRGKDVSPYWDSIDPEYRVFLGSMEEDNPEWDLGTRTPDLGRIAVAMSKEKIDLLKLHFRTPHNALSEITGGQEHLGAKTLEGCPLYLPPWAWLILEESLQTTLKAGFYLAVMRYADELGEVPELSEAVERMRRQRQKAGKKRGEARKKEADSLKKEAKRIDRELRDLPQFTTKESRIAEIAANLGKHERTIQKYFEKAQKPRK